MVREWGDKIVFVGGYRELLYQSPVFWDGVLSPLLLFSFLNYTYFGNQANNGSFTVHLVTSGGGYE